MLLYSWLVIRVPLFIVPKCVLNASNYLVIRIHVMVQGFLHKLSSLIPPRKNQIALFFPGLEFLTNEDRNACVYDNYQ